MEMQIGQLSRKLEAQANSSGGFIGNAIDNPEN